MERTERDTPERFLHEILIMGELMQTNDFVYVTDVDEFDIEAFKSWYQSLNKEYYPYSSEYLQIQKDDERFESRLLAFVKE